MQYPNNLPNTAPNPTPELAPFHSNNPSPLAQNTSTDEARVKQVALAALEQIATASTFEQRLKLGTTFINTGGKEAANLLSQRFTELGFAPTKKKEWNQCFDLVTRITHEVPDNALSLLRGIARQGGDAARELVTHINKDEIAPEDRLELCKLIAQQGVLQAIEIAEHFDQLGFYNKAGVEIIPGVSLLLCKEILNQGSDAAATLADNFNRVKLPEDDIFPFINYAVYKGLQRQFIENEEFFANIPEEYQVPVLVDLLSPPSGLRGSVDLTQFESFTEPIADLLPILNKEPGNINEADIQSLKNYINESSDGNVLKPIMNEIEKDTQKMIRDNLLKDSKKTVKKGEAKITEEAAFFRAGMYSWLAYAAVVVEGAAPEQVEDLVKNNCLQLIASYPHSTLRYSLTRLFGTMPEEEFTALSIHENSKKDAQEMTQLEKISHLLSPLANFGASEQKILALRTQIKNTRALKQVSVSSALAQLLSTITLNGPYTEAEADKIAEGIIKALKQPEITGKTAKRRPEKEGEEKIKKEIRTKEELTKNDLAALTNILQMLGKKEMFDFVAPENNNISAETYFQNNFKKFFDVDEKELEKLGMTFEEQYKKTFGQFRDPLALFSYYKGINRLPSNEKAPVLATLNTFVNSVLREDFKDVRYNPENSAHLTKVFSARPDLQSLWCTPLPSRKVVLEDDNDEKESEAVGGTKDLESETKEKMEESDNKFELMEIDDPCDLLLIGTDVRGSCQSVFADPQKNQALPSYLLNGENKFFGIKKNGKVVARVLLRLMWDKKNKCPVLLQEDLFSSVMNESFVEAINAFTKEKAKSMRIPLVSLNIESEVRYKGKVNFLGGMAPVGYSDSTVGLLVKHPKTSPLVIPKIIVGMPPSHTPPANAPFDVLDTYLLYDPMEDEKERVALHI